MLQTDAEHVAREVDHLAAAQCGAEKLHAGFGQLMCLVEYRDVDAREQLGHAAVAQRHVGKEKMVIDDNDVGGHRIAPRLHHVALAVLGALRAETVLARRGHQRNHAAALVEALHLGEVAGRVGDTSQVVEAARHVVGVTHAAALAEHRLEVRARRGEVAHELACHGQSVERYQRGALVAQPRPVLTRVVVGRPAVRGEHVGSPGRGHSGIIAAASEPSPAISG